MSNFNHLVINKNRGWRGLAEAKIIDLDTKEELKMIFSFSQQVWNDLIFQHTIVLQDETYYYIVRFEDKYEQLPGPLQQRSVLIKNFNADITEIVAVKKTEWTSERAENWNVIMHHIKNRNNHTTSDWNCIGIRVVPEI